MATKKDIEADITLEIDGDLPTPNQLATAISAFSALLNNAQREVDNDSAIKWGVQVKKGSNLVEYIPSIPMNQMALAVIANGIKHFETTAERPSGFSEAMLFNLQNLCEVAKTGKKQKTTINLWLNKEPVNLSENVKSNINKVLQGAFSEYGSVEGMLQTLDSHAGYQFVIYEPLYNKKIVCSAGSDEVPSQAHSLWEKRVEAEGMIKYSHEGIPYEIKVEKISALVPVSGIPSYKLTKGILKQYV